MPRSRRLRDPSPNSTDRAQDPPRAAPIANSGDSGTSIPQPARPSRATLPHALTFFLTSSQRRAVLAALRRVHRQREHALLRVLGVSPG